MAISARAAGGSPTAGASGPARLTVPAVATVATVAPGTAVASVSRRKRHTAIAADPTRAAIATNPAAPAETAGAGTTDPSETTDTAGAAGTTEVGRLDAAGQILCTCAARTGSPSATTVAANWSPPPIRRSWPGWTTSTNSSAL
ncbi:hypothetical protein OSJ11_16600, partial [Mycobacterium ulcerans]